MVFVNDVQSNSFCQAKIKNSSKIEEEIPVDEEEKKRAKGHLNSSVFCQPFTNIALIPSIAFDCQYIIMHFLLDKIINIFLEHEIAQGHGTSFDSMLQIMKFIYEFIGLAVGGGIFQFFGSYC
jgi:hypothetical protein